MTSAPLPMFDAEHRVDRRHSLETAGDVRSRSNAHDQEMAEQSTSPPTTKSSSSPVGPGARATSRRIIDVASHGRALHRVARGEEQPSSAIPRYGEESSR